MAFSKLAGFFSLQDPTNKVSTNDLEERKEGVVSDLEQEIQFKLSDEELSGLAKTWKKKWDAASGDLVKMQKQNEKYWLGTQHEALGGSVVANNDLDNKPQLDNRIFMAAETFLPIATRQNPDPVVTSPDESEDATLWAAHNRELLIYFADVNKLKQVLRRCTRYWLLYLLGPVKVGFDEVENIPVVKAERPQKLILDPTSTIDDGGYTGEYIGLVRSDTAETLITRFPASAEGIRSGVGDKLGTEIQYVEWWTDELVFWTLKGDVLDKKKTPYFNYDDVEETITDEFGNEELVTNAPSNHFRSPKMPYDFLSVFNLGKKPYDDTSLLSQVLSLQDIVNKRLKQIDRNADGANAGLMVSGDVFDKDAAKNAGEALRQGKTILVPSGNVSAAIVRDSGTPLQGFVAGNLEDVRNEIDNIFGTHGTTRGERGATETATGRVVLKGQDEGRIAFVSAFLEQVADNVYNKWYQMILTMYDQDDVAEILGEEKASEWMRIKDNPPRLVISVKDGSMTPRDPITKRNEAIDLFQIGALDLQTLLEELDIADPERVIQRLSAQAQGPGGLLQEEGDQAIQAEQPAVEQVVPQEAFV